MRPRPFSFTSFSTFVTCPRQYHAKYILKTVKDDPDTPHLVWGRQVHTAFENRQRDQVPLPAGLGVHEQFMQQLDKRPGELEVEMKVALNTSLEPCDFFDPKTFYRGIVDWLKVDRAAGRAYVVDYKTGKRRPKWDQLALNALWVFAAHPGVRLVSAEFYWTQDCAADRKVWGAAGQADLWAKMKPDLRQYAQAHIEDVWQPRQSGLCRAHCPVLDCEFNGKGR